MMDNRRFVGFMTMAEFQQMMNEASNPKEAPRSSKKPKKRGKCFSYPRGKRGKCFSYPRGKRGKCFSYPRGKRKSHFSYTERSTNDKVSPTPQKGEKEESTMWENPLDRLNWRRVYDEVSYIRDYPSDQLIVEVKDYHRQSYPMNSIIAEYLRYERRRGASWHDVMRGPVATGSDLYPLYKWLIDTGQFPYPYEVAVGVRRHFIDMKLLL